MGTCRRLTQRRQNGTPCTVIVDVPLAERSYRIHLHGGLLGDPMHAAWRSVPAPSVALVVSDTNVWPLYGERLLACLGALGTTAHSIVLPAGEATKSLAHLSSVWDAALQLGADRDLCVVALGGGVVGDIAGFAAASVLRGVRFWQVPTSLLAMVDSSVGGKTGINHATGKNLLGAFYQPDVVLADLDTLSTLPPREVSAGLAEAVKHGVVLDAALVARMESSAEALVGLNPTAIAPVVARCCALKAEVVAADEREAGLRKVLNFGHTIGHALERVLGYGALLHGEAMSVCMVAATYVA